MMQLEETIKQFNMIKKDDIIIVGLSGGADSVALTHYLRFVLKCRIIACHVNHHLRGDESDRDMTFVNALCDEWDIPCFIKEANISGYAKNYGMTLEEAGREVRYQTFEELLSTQKADKIATAHTLSDSAETILLNLSRGTGIKGLCGIPPVRGNIIRPLIFTTREQIEAYCKENNLIYVDDSTNFCDDFNRNKIRHNVIPILTEINRGFYSNIKRTIALMSEDSDYIEAQAANAWFFCEKLGKLRYDISLLSTQEKPLRTRVLANILDEVHINRSFFLLERLDSMLKQGGKINVASNLFATISNGILSFSPPDSEIEFFEQEIFLNTDEAEFLSPAMEKFKIKICEYKHEKEDKKVYKNLLYLCIDYDKIKGKLFVRQRKSGDEIEFSHRAGTKMLKKFFIDEKLSAYEKSKVPVFVDDEGVVAVFGFGVANRAVTNESTKKILTVELL